MPGYLHGITSGWPHSASTSATHFAYQGAAAAQSGNQRPRVIRATNSPIIEHMRRYDRPCRLNRRSESAVPCPSAPTTNRRRTSTINTKPVATQSNGIEQDRTDSNASRSPNAVFFAATSQEKSSRKPEIRLECSAHSARTDRTMPNKTEQPERPISSKTLEISLPERSKTPSPEHPNKHASCSPRAPERTRKDLK